jgi:xanthine dehydrogenase YagS FAD-binding subunit
MSWQIGIDEPLPFELLRPQRIEDALELRAKYGSKAAYLAGGCDLIEQLKLQWSTYEYVIRLKAIAGLRGIAAGAETIDVRALTTLAEIERDPGLRRDAAALTQAAARVATPQIRNMGTIGGNLLQDSRCFYYRGPWHCYRAGGIICDAHHGVSSEHALFGADRCHTVSPSDTAPALVALDARAVVRDAAGEREMPVADLFVLPAENIRAMHRLKDGGILTGVRIAARPGRKSVFLKYAQRNAWDFAIASVAVALTIDRGAALDVRVVLGAVAPAPWRCKTAEQTLAGRPLTPAAIEAAAQAAVAGAEPAVWNEYKIPLARKLVREALTALAPA